MDHQTIDHQLSWKQCNLSTNYGTFNFLPCSMNCPRISLAKKTMTHAAACAMPQCLSSWEDAKTLTALVQDGLGTFGILGFVETWAWFVVLFVWDASGVHSLGIDWTHNGWLEVQVKFCKANWVWKMPQEQRFSMFRNVCQCIQWHTMTSQDSDFQLPVPVGDPTKWASELGMFRDPAVTPSRQGLQEQEFLGRITFSEGRERLANSK